MLKGQQWREQQCLLNRGLEKVVMKLKTWYPQRATMTLPAQNLKKFVPLQSIYYLITRKIVNSDSNVTHWTFKWLLMDSCVVCHIITWGAFAFFIVCLKGLLLTFSRYDSYKCVRFVGHKISYATFWCRFFFLTILMKHQLN